MVELNKKLIIEKCGNEPTLDMIKLSENNINKIDPKRLFNGLSNLRDLHLESNKLYRIERSCFDHLNSIRVILLDCTEFKVFSFLDREDKDYFY